MVNMNHRITWTSSALVIVKLRTLLALPAEHSQPATHRWDCRLEFCFLLLIVAHLQVAKAAGCIFLKKKNKERIQYAKFMFLALSQLGQSIRTNLGRTGDSWFMCTRKEWLWMMSMWSLGRLTSTRGPWKELEIQRLQWVHTNHNTHGQIRFLPLVDR